VLGGWARCSISGHPDGEEAMGKRQKGTGVEVTTSRGRFSIGTVHGTVGSVVTTRDGATYVDGCKVSDRDDAPIHLGSGAVYVDGERVR
jgi:hypothetical protein